MKLEHFLFKFYINWDTKRNSTNIFLSAAHLMSKRHMRFESHSLITLVLVDASLSLPVSKGKHCDDPSIFRKRFQDLFMAKKKSSFLILLWINKGGSVTRVHYMKEIKAQKTVSGLAL